MSLFRSTENKEEFCSKLFLLKSKASNKYVRKKLSSFKSQKYSYGLIISFYFSAS